jgi:guanylate kinase
MTDVGERSTGNLFIVSAPSGGGKSTLCRAARERFPDLRYSISATARPPRPGEVHGRDYFFVSEEEFKRGIETGRWAEWAVVHGNYYGTPADFIRQTLEDGHDILLDIDVQGAGQLMNRFPDSISIFIMPPSMAILRERLEKRETDDPEVIRRRMENARKEVAAKERYEHIIINDDLQRAVANFTGIIASHRRPCRDGTDQSTEEGQARDQ